MTTLGLLVCGAFSDEIMKKYDGVYEDFFIDSLSAVDPNLSFKSYWVFEDKFPESVDDCDAWLITGSKAGVYENLPWMLRLQDFVRDAYAKNIPLVGICFGHQLIAAALGGEVVKSEKGWGAGFSQYDLTAPLPGIAGDVLRLNAIHQDQVVALPADATVIASSPHCPNAGLRYNGSAISFQPHPEFSADFERDLITSIRGDTMSEEVADQAIASLERNDVHNKEVMALIAQFVKGE